MVSFLSEKSLGVHAQRMLKMSRVYTLAEILGKIFVKRRRKIGDLIYNHGLTNLRFGANLIFNKIYNAITACNPYIRKMLTKSEMITFQK